MSPEQALSVLDQATQPSAQLDRRGYILVEQALKVISDLINPTSAEPVPAPKAE